MDFSRLEFILVMSVDSCICEEKMAYNVWCRRTPYQCTCVGSVCSLGVLSQTLIPEATFAAYLCGPNQEPLQLSVEFLLSGGPC